ncbi:unnamed protein product [Echinostoma caproni]|uniref:BEN domain-containing protein n=1 Tax=Echinostoma caproni TaxID=27848 RepID=A0A3P8FV43_9TREM|nr:unnamed protein product [Echinostoma caproni]
MPREQLVSLLQKLQAENTHLRSQLSDCQERNRILQHTLPSMLKEFLARTASQWTPNKLLTFADHCPTRSSTRLATDQPTDVQCSPIHPQDGLNYSQERSRSPAYKVQETQTTEFRLRSTEPEMVTNSQPVAAHMPLFCLGNHLSVQPPKEIAISASMGETLSDKESGFTPTDLIQTPPISNVKTNGPDEQTDSPNSRGRLDPMRVEISRTEFRRIEATILSDPRVVESRDWAAYMQANEWTRATCSLMSALFTSDQMAQCTVLGRGVKEPRQRLPVDRATYIVAVISERFRVAPTRIRARMAQKCKDERRKHRNHLLMSMQLH